MVGAVEIWHHSSRREPYARHDTGTRTGTRPTRGSTTKDPVHAPAGLVPAAYKAGTAVTGWESLNCTAPLSHISFDRRIAAVSSLWTPEGEHRVERGDVGPEAASPPQTSGAPSDEVLAPDAHDEGELRQETAEEEMAELERQLASAPVEDVIANHCYGMFQLAALHLGQSPPRLDSARLAIDAFAAVVESLGERLGAASDSLRDGLAQIRLAFVQIAAVEQARTAPAQANDEGTPSEA
jgi:hypothetical protein